ncbi:hypothetical protein CCAX7_002530 [Capsulimonas corticalis]|uniref:Uncharacterized protein n=1 Tax=Capsulimonas corticalis TaxID=2219043 RepID=A0A402CS28_9BACT|nr:carbohydrate-binding protein [Capsulimonas corticalis]BDI28202.1 hypothetical protein CCAX7_002530 [Capsulimonas corticalis]
MSYLRPSRTAALIGAIGFLGGAASRPALAQMPGSYTTSWLGDTFGQGGSSTATGQYWMQDYIAQMTVQSDGTCWTSGPWDEGGRTNGEYKDGLVVGNQNNNINNQSVSVGGHTWTINGASVTSDDGRSLPSPGAPGALGVASNGQLLVADNGSRSQVLFYNVSGTPSLAGTFGVQGGISASYTATYDVPAATNSPDYPTGTYGPGVYHPFKLWNMTGVGEDSTGRLFVSREDTGGGSAILCFKQNGSGNWVLNWRIEGYCFVDNVDFDASTDGQDVYGVQEHYKMDYTQTLPGAEWSIYGFTADNLHYLNDPRNVDTVHAGQEHGLTSCWYRNVGGHRLLFVEGMTTQMLNIFRFQSGNDVAVPTGLVMETSHTIYGVSNGLFWPPNRPASGSGTTIWSDTNDDGNYQSGEFSAASYGYTYGQWIDSAGNIWWGGNPLVESKLTSFDSAGNPVYASSGVQSFNISGMPSVGNIQYEEAQDRMVLCDKAGEGLTGGSIYVINGWSTGNRTATKVFTMTSNQPTGFSAAGDYLFEVGYASRGKVWVHSLVDGSLTGTMDVPSSLGGNGYSGNVDIGYGIHAFKRANGEYEVAVEDDYMAKVLLYRWNPNGAVGGGGTPEAAYHGPHNIPGSMEAEDYDTGGQGVGYNQTNAGGQTGYRTDNNGAIEANTADNNGYDIGWAGSGQWAKYTVVVASAGAYTVSFRVASPTGQTGAFHLQDANGNNLSGPINVPNTGAWNAWQNVTATVTLPAGSQILEIVQDNSGWNLDSISFAASTGTGTTSYEAEATANTIGNGAYVDTNSAASGGQVVRYIGGSADGYVTVNNVMESAASTQTMTVYYYTGARNFAVSVNGGADQTLTCSNANGGSVTMAVTLSAGANTIKFHNAASYAPDLDRITVTGATTPSAPSAPTGLTAAAGNAQVALSWTAASGATSYSIFRGTASGGESATAIVTGVTGTTYTNTGLTNGTTYYYEVKAVNSAGSSGYSNEASAKPVAPTAPAAPTGLAATAGNAQVSLSWTASSGATSYSIFRGTTSGGESATAIATGVTGTTYTNTGLTNGTTYYYEVKAVNSAGSSGYSNEDLAEPGTLPDLIVTALTWTPAAPASGSAVTFTTTVRNIGAAATPSGTVVGVGYSVSGLGTVTWEDQDSTSLAAGASRAETATGGSSGKTWTAASGSYTITAFVDDVNRISEQNESNNTLAKSLTVP